jgi:hypothetical protein
MSRIRQHLRSNIIGYIALFFALSTGSAVALSGSNTVFTDDIVDNQVYSGDVRNDTLSGGGLGAPDLRPNSVGASEVSNLTWQPLTPKNGWVTSSGTGTPGIAKSVEGVVYLRGRLSLSSGTSTNPFAVPAGFAPSEVVLVPVDQSAGTTGRLEFFPGGEVFVTHDPDHPNQPFISLAGVSYTLPY